MRIGIPYWTDDSGMHLTVARCPDSEGVEVTVWSHLGGKRIKLLPQALKEVVEYLQSLPEYREN